MTLPSAQSQGAPDQPPAPSAPVADPRFPWKARGTRKPLTVWDRGKFLLFIGILFGLLVWNLYVHISPPATWWETAAQVATDQAWLVWLGVAELVRQLHFLISERSRRYHRLWSQRVFGRTNRAVERRFTPWTRFRLARVVKIAFWVTILAVVLGKVTDAPPVVALFKAPALALQALPFILQVVAILAIAVLQFVAIFWFLSRGGVETYFPDDIETRFSDVWGQDHVLAQVKENVILLEDPESIEAKGGHVPSGILLWGPPGTGKTLMAEAVAGETGKPYVFVEPGAFTAMFFGVGVMKVKALFRKLRKLALRYGGVIVFFDEADTLGSRSRSMQPEPGMGGAGACSPAGCGSPGYLSPATRQVLQRQALAQRPDAGADAPRQRSRFIVGGGMGGGQGSFDGTLQSLLTELSGLKKPRGFFNRVVRKTLGMRPKPPPKYRILVMMASNLPQALDPALLRPGRIDRIYKVGYPSKAGRLRTYQGYLDKVTHDLTPEQVDKLATITPYATGAGIKDLVNEALINAIREDRTVVTWQDIIKAKHMKALGPSEGVEYIETERHATAIHEACHAVLHWRTSHHQEIDIATIEKGGDYLGMVNWIPPEERFTQWRSEYESDVMVFLASLAGERLFYGGDNSSGVGGDLRNATMIAGLMEGHWGMGTGVSSLPSLKELGIVGGLPEDKRKNGGGVGFGAPLGTGKKDDGGGALGQRVEFLLARLLDRAEAILIEHRAQVLSLAHALETHKTLAGEDVVAVLEGRQGQLVDGRPYAEPGFIAELDSYHAQALDAHRQHRPLAAPLPKVVISGQLVSADPGGNGARVVADAPDQATG